MELMLYVVGYYHIHTITGWYNGKHYDSERFSQADIDVLTSEPIYLNYAFVGTLAGKVLKFESHYATSQIKKWQKGVVDVGTWKDVYSPTTFSNPTVDSGSFQIIDSF